MEDKQKNNDRTNELDRYERIVDRAHKEIECVHSEYKRLLTILGIIITAGITMTTWLTYKSFSELKSDLNQRFDRLSKEVSDRIAKEFDEKNIQELVNKEAQKRIDAIADNLIAQQIERKISPQIDDINRRINAILVEIQGKVDESLKKQKIVSEEIDTYRLYYSARIGNRQSFEKLLSIANTQSSSQQGLAKTLLEDIRVYYLDYKFQMYEQRLTLPNTIKEYNPCSEFIYNGIFNLNTDFPNRSACINKISQLKLQYFVEELIRVIKDDPDLKIAALAVKAVENLSGEKFNGIPPFKDVLDWWEKTGKTIEKYKSPFPEIKKLEETSSSMGDEELLNSLLKIVKDKQGLAATRFEIAKIYLKRNQQNEAIEQLKIIYNECEGYIPALEVYAHLLVKINEKNKAIEVLQKINDFSEDKIKFRNSLMNSEDFKSLSSEKKFQELIREQKPD